MLISISHSEVKSNLFHLRHLNALDVGVKFDICAWICEGVRFGMSAGEREDRVGSGRMRAGGGGRGAPFDVPVIAHYISHTRSSPRK